MNAGKMSGSLWRFGLKFESDIDAGHRYQTLDTGYQISDIRHQTSDIRHRTSQSRHWIWDIGRQTSDIRQTDIGHRTLNIRHQTSDIRHLTYDIRHLTSKSDIGHLISGQKGVKKLYFYLPGAIHRRLNRWIFNLLFSLITCCFFMPVRDNVYSVVRVHGSRVVVFLLFCSVVRMFIVTCSYLSFLNCSVLGTPWDKVN